MCGYVYESVCVYIYICTRVYTYTVYTHNYICQWEIPDKFWVNVSEWSHFEPYGEVQFSIL